MIRPGFVNAHTRIAGTHALPAAPLDERTLRAAARLYVAEALLRGTTGLVDHHASAGFIAGSLDVLAEACRELGMRAVLCYGATERPGGRDEARAGLAECRRLSLAQPSGLVRGAVGLHASSGVSDDTAREAGALARELGTVVHVHVACEPADVDDARERGFEGPLQRLLALDALPPGSILAHGVWITDADVRLADERGLWLVQCPRANERHDTPYPRALVESRRVALGTEGFPSDMREELVHLWRIARANGDPASDLALDDRLETSRAMLAERFPPGALDGDTVELGDASPGRRPAVRNVTVAGRVVVDDGVLVTGDIEGIRAGAGAATAALRMKMENITCIAGSRGTP